MALIKYHDKKDKYYPYLIKNINNNNYFYNIITNAIYLLDKEAYNILVEGYDTESEGYTDTVEFFKENFILVTPENDKKLEEMYSEVVRKKKYLNASGLTLMISQECNLRCKYCYGKDGEYSNKGKMDFATAKNAIDYFVNQAPSDKLSICFFGGEPLLNFDLMKKVIIYVREVEQKTDKKFSFSMTTNATLINEEIRSFINQNNISLTVSIDGARDMNDTNRFYGNRMGIYDDIKKNISNLDTYMVARATIAPPNLNVSESVKHLVEEFDFRSVAWAEADNLLSDEDYEAVKENAMKLINTLEGFIKEGKFEEVKKYGSFMDMLKKFNSDGIRSKGCGAGSNMMAVDIDGKIYPCHRFVGIKQFVIGDVLDNKKENSSFYSVVDLINFEKCQSCIAKSICGGGCINENYYTTSEINKPSERHCEYIVAIVDRMLEVYILLDEISKKQIFAKK